MARNTTLTNLEESTLYSEDYASILEVVQRVPLDLLLDVLAGEVVTDGGLVVGPGQRAAG